MDNEQPDVDWSIKSPTTDKSDVLNCTNFSHHKLDGSAHEQKWHLLLVLFGGLHITKVLLKIYFTTEKENNFLK